MLLKILENYWTINADKLLSLKTMKNFKKKNSKKIKNKLTANFKKKSLNQKMNFSPKFN